MPSIAMKRETTPGLRYRRRFRSLTFRPGLQATEDGSGALWLAPREKVCSIGKTEVWHRLETASEFAKSTPTTAFTDWMGRAWFGYEGGTIILLKDENIQRVFPADDSPVGSVRAIEGRGRHIWVGGELGLAFFDGNRFRRIVPADAETFGSVMGVEETSNGSLWLAESRGVIRDRGNRNPTSPGESLLPREVSCLRLFRRPFRYIRGQTTRRFREPTANFGSLRQTESFGSILPTSPQIHFLRRF